VVRGGLTRHQAPGKHSTLMEEPHVQRVAQLMRTVLTHGEQER
jgi:thioesterase domain-containing protein